MARFQCLLILLAQCISSTSSFLVVGPKASATSATIGATTATFIHQHGHNNGMTVMRSSSSSSDTADEVPLSKAPSFNGKMIFPMKVFLNGLKGHKVAAVFAVYNNQYKRGKGEWNHVQHISITKDLYNELENLSTQYSSTQVAYVRALSFVYPQKSAMLEVANRWKGTVDTEHGGIVPWGTVTDNDTNDADTSSAANNADTDIETNTETTVASETTSEKDDAEMTEREKIIQLIKDTAMFDDDDDEDDDEFEFDDDNDILSSEEVTKNIDATRTNSNSDDIISPFDSNNGATITDTDTNTDVEEEGEAPPALTDENGQLVFNPDNVNAVLDEIRPYLISDGGNVSVQRIDVDTRSVYLKLEGACGSCASSTVTMSMGIERVLKENFDNLGEVLQVEDEVTDGGDAGGDGSDAEGLTEDAVIAELKRIGPAITAMGGNVEIVSVDPIGVVELRYRGSTKIQQGLELAIRDVPLVKHVKFVN